MTAGQYALLYGIPMFLQYALSSYALTCELLTESLSHNTVSRHSACVDRRLVTTGYGVSIVAEQ